MDAAAVVADVAMVEATAAIVVRTERDEQNGPDRSFRSWLRSRIRSRASARPVEPTPTRAVESGRTQPSGPPPGYQPMLLPGESISKYQRYAQQSPAPAASSPVDRCGRDGSPGGADRALWPQPSPRTSPSLPPPSR